METDAAPQAVDALDVTDRHLPDSDTEPLSIWNVVVIFLLAGLLWVPIVCVVWILF
jgi:hypothetical protein